MGRVDWQSTLEGSRKTLQGLPLTVLILGAVDWQSTWEGSAKTLQGLPLTVLILRGSIDSQLWKDPQRLCKDYLWQCWSSGGQLTVNLRRIHEDFARITSDSVDPGVLINSQLVKDQQRLCKDYLGQCWSWVGGSIDSQLGKDLQRLCKDCLWQCWFWGVGSNWQST